MTDTTNQEEPEVRRRGGPFNFIREVRAEGRKVTWATRNEVLVSTIMVVVMGIAAAIFFFVVDMLMSGAISLILGLNKQ